MTNEIENKEDDGMSRMQNPNDLLDKTPVIVARTDVSEVDNDFFLCPVNILDHKGFLLCEFPVENRIIQQNKNDLKIYLEKNSRVKDTTKFSDFHLLLYISVHFDSHDIISLCTSVKNKEPILEGYKYLIESIADIN